MATIILQHVIQKFQHKLVGEVGSGQFETIPQVMEDYQCSQCGKMHHVLYVITRKQGKQWGHFIGYAINGNWQIVDLTLPHEVDRIPRDAIRVPDYIADATWHSNGHYCQLTDGKEYFSFYGIRRLVNAQKQAS